MIRKSEINKYKLKEFNRIQKNLEPVKNKLRAENVKARDKKKSEQTTPKDCKKSEQVTPQEKMVYEDTTKQKKKASRKEIKAQEEKLYAESIEKAGVDYSQIKEPKNAKLTRARESKNDEFYTRLSDVENELKHYRQHFKDKTVLCNCDDPTFSAFWKYFHMNFRVLGLKKLIGTHYEKENPHSYAVIYKGGNDDNTDFYTKYEDLKGNGDFRSNECIEYLKECDIVVTNPPFSLFREYVEQLISYDKQFLIIGNINAITYKEIFKLIQDNKAWLGVNLGRGISGFIVPTHYELYGTETKVDKSGNKIISTNNCLWLTNLDNFIRHKEILLTKSYCGNEQEYPKYDNYDAINVNRTKNIPKDYFGYMGVPITFLHKFNCNQFEIIKFRKGDDGKDLSIKRKCPYFRIIIKRKQL